MQVWLLASLITCASLYASDSYYDEDIDVPQNFVSVSNNPPDGVIENSPHYRNITRKIYNVSEFLVPDPCVKESFCNVETLVEGRKYLKVDNLCDQPINVKKGDNWEIIKPRSHLYVDNDQILTVRFSKIASVSTIDIEPAYDGVRINVLSDDSGFKHYDIVPYVKVNFHQRTAIRQLKKQISAHEQPQTYAMLDKIALSDYYFFYEKKVTTMPSRSARFSQGFLQEVYGQQLVLKSLKENQ